MAWPPRCTMAVSKETRVRSEGFSKMQARTFPRAMASLWPVDFELFFEAMRGGHVRRRQPRVWYRERK